MTKTKAKPKAKTKAPVRAPVPAGTEIRGTIAIARLRPSPTNPRQSFPEESLRELAASFATHGVLSPLLVRPVPLKNHPPVEYRPEYGDESGWVNLSHFEIVDGERRYRAAKLAGVKQLPVTIRWLTDAEVLVLQLIANDQREDVKPSEQSAAYGRLAAAGKTAEQIAVAVGKPVGFVRGLLRLAKLPAWALAAVDAGRLPRATAELVARVPGEESRKKAAACVLLGLDRPKDLLCDWNDGDSFEEECESIGDGHRGSTPGQDESILSYRKTRELIRTHFTRELKGAPFSRKALDLIDGVGACDDCPDRAGNDPEAVADGVRADTCLNPDCFRAKVWGSRAKSLEQAAAKGIVSVPGEFAWPMSCVNSDHPAPPKGWCLADAKAVETEFRSDTPAGKLSEPLKKLIGKDCQQYIAFHADKPVYLVKTAEARKALIAAGVIAKPEPRKREKPAQDRGEEIPHPPTAATPKTLAEPRPWEIDDRANLIAAVKVRDCAEANFESLDALAANGGPETDAAYEALRFVAKVLIRDWLEVGDTRLDLLKSYVPDLPDSYGSDQVKQAAVRVYKAIEDAPPRRMLGFLLHLTAGVRIAQSIAERAELLGHYDVDWEQCRTEAKEQLMRELNEPTEAA